MSRLSHVTASWVLLLCGGALLAAGEASADTVCTPSASPLAFGPVSGTAPVDTSGIIRVTCVTGGIQVSTIVSVNACLSIGGGAAGGTSIAPYRRMRNPSRDELQFQIYRDSARSQIWGSLEIPGSTPVQVSHRYDILVGTGATSTFDRTMHGRIPGQPGLAAGTYQNIFSGVHARLDYRFQQNLLVAIPPRSCTEGGRGGGSVSFNFTASATVPGHCTISGATDLDFGRVPGLIRANRDQSSTITMTCTNRTAWNLALDEGRNASGTSRRMQRTGGGGHVTYGLYRDAARTQRWGSTPGTDTEQGTGTGLQQSRTVHGRVFPGQSVPAGTYRDTITVTVTY